MRSVRSCPADPDAVTILTHEVAASGYMRGGKPRKPAPALPDPRTIVHDYLAAMERAIWTGAEQILGAGFHMTFPGRRSHDPAARTDRLGQGPLPLRHQDL